MSQNFIPRRNTDPEPAAVEPAHTPSPGGLFNLVVGVIIVAALYFGREVLMPVTLAILLSFVLAPLVGLLRRLPLGRTAPVLLAVALALAVGLGLTSVIGTQIAELAQRVPIYASTIEHKMETLRGLTLDRINAMIRGIDRQVEREAEGQKPSSPSNPAAEEQTKQVPKPVPVEVHSPAPTPLELTERILSPLAGPLSTAALVFVVTVFALLQREDLRDRLIRLTGSSDLHRTTLAMNDAAKRLSRYFLTQFAVNAGFGVIIGIGLFLIGVPSPILWGILGGLLRFVPYVGTLLSAVIPLALAAAVDPGWTKLIFTAGLYFVVEPAVGQVVEPLVYGHSTGLSPFAVIVAAIFWGWLWGPVGLIISTPLTLLLVVLGRHVKRLEFFDVLLGDRPPLTPMEGFYQRMLAENPAEAQSQAELLLKERSLSSYYDEVALKGLQLAAADVHRGQLGPAQMERVKSGINRLIEELDSYPDVDPPSAAEEKEPETGPAGLPNQSEQELPKSVAPQGETPPESELPPAWRTETPVLCVAGSGPFDEAASTMLAQLVRKHGFGAKVLTHDMALPERLPSANVRGTAMVCICYLQLSGTPAYLEYLVRRLRRRLPGAVVLVGLWPEDDPILSDVRLRSALGADYYTSSLREAVEDCLEAARNAAEGAAA
ncbi:MAG: AI-2E family transporter [Verrucomicrobia bacterium]|nr:AI-2E family transporter [Verrucomicrobiota bacterium]